LPLRPHAGDARAPPRPPRFWWGDNVDDGRVHFPQGLCPCDPTRGTLALPRGPRASGGGQCRRRPGAFCPGALPLRLHAGDARAPPRPPRFWWWDNVDDGRSPCASMTMYPRFSSRRGHRGPQCHMHEEDRRFRVRSCVHSFLSQATTRAADARRLHEDNAGFTFCSWFIKANAERGAWSSRWQSSRSWSRPARQRSPPPTSG
jgi:hypothetical protein